MRDRRSICRTISSSEVSWGSLVTSSITISRSLMPRIFQSIGHLASTKGLDAPGCKCFAGEGLWLEIQRLASAKVTTRTGDPSTPNPKGIESFQPRVGPLPLPAGLPWVTRHNSPPTLKPVVSYPPASGRDDFHIVPHISQALAAGWSATESRLVLPASYSPANIGP